MKAGTDPKGIETVAVIGAGTMGHGIAQVAAAAGYRVTLRDVDRDSLARGIQNIERNLAKGIQLAKLTEAERDQTLQYIRGTTHLEDVATADLIIEAAPELLELKGQILEQLESFSDRPFIFASNTLSLSITTIAASSTRPQNVVGMHFFNPVHIMRLLEIVVGKRTSEETVATVFEVGRKLRKEP
ncbi:MAG TPA: 3-hydroxyacyl-CoA dehydrogenase NAD-binding domain-containing protein, partial [Pyrinomonadaceae bacterium]